MVYWGGMVNTRSVAGTKQQYVGLSVVSHCQGQLVHLLLKDLELYCRDVELWVIVTLNLPEVLPFSPTDFSFPITIVSNQSPKGFSSNHNAARISLRIQGGCDYFCVVNPDVRLMSNVFPLLFDCINDEPATGMVAPLVRDSRNRVESSARPLPTPFAILSKVFGLGKEPIFSAGKDCVSVDWLAGMFMLFPSNAFAEIGGFDERYHLYYEDVDICSRLWLAGWKVRLVRGADVIHDARRDSHRNLKYLAWHLASMTRFFLSPVFFRRWRQIHGFSGNRG